MTGAGARDAPRHDLPAIGDEPSESLLVLVVHEANLFQAQLAVLLLQTLAFTISRHFSSFSPSWRPERSPPLRSPPLEPRGGAPGNARCPPGSPGDCASRLAASAIPVAGAVLRPAPGCPSSDTPHTLLPAAGRC